MVAAPRPLSGRIAGTVTPLNGVLTLLLLAGGVGLSQLLSAPRFGAALLIVALLAIIPSALLLIVKPRFGVFLLFIVSMLIIEVKRLAWTLEVGIIIEFLEVGLAIGIALSVVTRRDSWRFSSSLTPIVLVFVAYQLLLSLHPSLPTTFHVIYALRDILNFTIPFFAAVYLIRDRQQLRFFLHLWLGTAVAIALYGLKQHFLGLTSWESAWLSISLTHVIYDRVRIFSTLGSADALGMHMAISIVLALGVAFHTRAPLVRYGLLATIPLFLVVALYTLTRGAYLAILVGVLTLALVTRSRALFLALALAAVGVVGWYQINQGSLLANRVMTMFAPEQDESYTIRENYVQKYLPVILENPFGLGPATTGRQGGVLLAWADVDPSLIQSLAGVPTDNYYFRIALENGWVGLLLFLGLLAAGLGVGLRTYFQATDPLVKWVAAGLVASYMALAIPSISNNYFSHVELKLFFWFSLGVLANLRLIERGEPAAGRAPMPASGYRWGGARSWA